MDAVPTPSVALTALVILNLMWGGSIPATKLALESFGPFTLASTRLIIAGGLVMVGSVGPVAAAVTDVIHPGLRSTAMSVLSLTQNLFGLAGGPLLTGLLSDAYGLPFAMSVVPVFCVFAAVLFLLAARTYEADRNNVHGTEPVANGGLSPQPA